MKKMVLVAAFAAGLSAFAGTNATTVAEINAKSGGLVAPPPTAKALVFLDARKERPEPTLTNTIAVAENMLSLAMERRPIKMGAKECPRKVAFDARKAGAGAVVLLYERDGEPTFTAFPEDAVVLVNVKALLADNPSELWYHRRIMTEFWRSIAFTLGGYTTPGPMGGASMQPIFSLEDFYSLHSAGLSPMQISSIAGAKCKLGIYSRNPVPYSRACREGWAPAPTNDVQKAIYEKMKTPTARFQKDFPGSSKPTK